MVKEEKFYTTDIGVLPAGWNVINLSEITTLMTNGFVGISKIHYTSSDDGVLYIQGYNVEENSFNFNGIKRVKQDFHMQHQKSRLQKDDLLTVQTGDVGLTTIIPQELEGSNCHALIITRFKKSRVFPKFFAYYFNSFTGRLRLKEIETGSTMKHINVGDMIKLKVPLPPLPEQQAIAEVLSDTDKLIQALESQIAKKRNIKQGAMQKLLQPKEGWKIKKLEEIATFFKGKGLPKSRLKENGKYKCIHYGELFTKYKENINTILSYTDENDACFYSISNDVLMPTSDVTPNGLATASCIKEDGVILGGDVLVIRLPMDILDGIFLSFYISQNRERVMSMVTGSTVYHLYGSDMKRFEITYPTIEEQIKTTIILSKMHTEICALETRLEKYKMLKLGMMQNLLSGKIRLIES